LASAFVHRDTARGSLKVKAMPSQQQKLWSPFAVVTVALLFVAAIIWIPDHPFGTSWDESLYFNQVMSDAARVKTANSGVGKLKALAWAFLMDDAGRPPAFRVLALPVTYAFGFSPTTVRLVSILFLVATLGLTYATVRRVASASSAAFSVVFLALCPGIIFQSMTFGTEYPLFLATSGMLYFLFSQWNAGKDSVAGCVGLGISLGLGAMAKASFLLIGGPALLMSFVFSLRKNIANPTPRSLILSGLIGLFIALPWWVVNFQPAVALAEYARNFSRHSLGSSSFSIWATWTVLFAQNGLGFPLTVVSLSILIAWIANHAAGAKESIYSTRMTIVLACFLSPLPLLVAHLSGNNQNLMHVTPLLPFLAVGFGVLTETVKWDTIKYFGTAVAALLAIQLVMILLPLINRSVFPIDPAFSSGRPPWLVMARMDQWDWNKLRSLCRLYRLDRPTIGFLGNARSLNSPGIAYPWILNNEPLPKVTWLWRYEQGAIDLEKVVASANISDIVLTAPTYVGMRMDKQDLDNRHNAEFVERLQRDSTLCGPIHLQMGRFEAVDIVVFINRRVVNDRCDQLLKSQEDARNE
jgi:4-amino-4-deoxy-L-arabinose transferase-like glycosyltransferase